nr:hypothetical protein [Thiocapsa sp.]
MKIPMSPPDTDALLLSIVETGGSAHLAKLLRNPSGPAPDGRYLHWDELRRRQPPPDLGTEDWWFSVKAARRLLYKNTPFMDKAGRPFVFALVDPILALLHRIDRPTITPSSTATAESPAPSFTGPRSRRDTGCWNSCRSPAS